MLNHQKVDTIKSNQVPSCSHFSKLINYNPIISLLNLYCCWSTPQMMYQQNLSPLKPYCIPNLYPQSVIQMAMISI